MPSYFYHLKFELYPHADLGSATYRGITEAKKIAGPRDDDNPVWLPAPGEDIFDNETWPGHKLAEEELQQQEAAAAEEREDPARRRGGKKEGAYTGRRLHDKIGTAARLAPSHAPTSSTTAATSRLGIIDCGRARVSAPDDAESTIVSISSSKSFEFPPPSPALIPSDQRTAVKDWRFGRVRVESVDMAPAGAVRAVGGLRGGEGQQQNGGGGGRVVGAPNNGINAGLATGASAGRVTKARYEALEGKNTELGWGIVHLYRDGEESPELGEGRSGVEVYNAETSTAPAEHGISSGGLGVQDDEGVADKEDYTTLCIPAVPSYLTPSDFLGFVGEKTREDVSHFRMVMTGRMNRYLVLMKFRDNITARRWRAAWDGKVFNSMEPETCHVTFVKSITFQTPNSSRPNTSFPELSHDPFTPSTSASAFLKPFPPPTPNLVELPTCPVCLERMDDTTGLLTILCQHVFHCDCLQKWRGSGCPVCRHTNPSLSLSSSQNNTSNYPYDPSNPPFGSGEASLCSVCDCTDDLWICLICGNVGCGRYKGGHAKEHWKDSAHNFALEIETQHVWDYAGDLWVHRLIRDKGDGKVVELPSSSRSGLGSGRGDHGEMEMVPREKLEGIGMEYTHLLTSQLESQRVYFEDLVGKAVAKASAASSAAAGATIRADEALAKLNELRIENLRLRDEVVAALEKDLAREKKKAERSSEMARAFGKSLTEEKKVSEGLMERIGHVNESMMSMSKELSQLKEETADLHEQNRDLLFSISAQQKLQAMEGEDGGLAAGELQEGTLSLPPEKKKAKGKGRGK